MVDYRLIDREDLFAGWGGVCTHKHTLVPPPPFKAKFSVAKRVEDSGAHFDIPTP